VLALDLVHGTGKRGNCGREEYETGKQSDGHGSGFAIDRPAGIQWSRKTKPPGRF
jgi:hypothetical protein